MLWILASCYISEYIIVILLYYTYYTQQASFYQLIPNIIWVWLTGKRNRLKRQQCLVTALSRQDKQLFARKPRRISVPHSPRASKCITNYTVSMYI